MITNRVSWVVESGLKYIWLEVELDLNNSNWYGLEVISWSTCNIIAKLFSYLS